MSKHVTICPIIPVGEWVLIPDRDRPINVTYSDTYLHVTLANGRSIRVPLENYPALTQATPEQRANVQLSLGGIYWPDLNLDLSPLDLLNETSSSPRRHKPRFCEG